VRKEISETASNYADEATVPVWEEFPVIGEPWTEVMDEEVGQVAYIAIARAFEDGAKAARKAAAKAIRKL